tara:strand:+ start:3084 stop:3887 length:804 start_codon:yes stop_codon:yes gene_type:complete
MYKIIIPSYKRVDTLIKKTLKSLYKTDIIKDIYVFVADKEEYEIYKTKLKDFSDIKVIIGVRGIPNQRNYIQKFFKIDDFLVFIDDDIAHIRGLDANNKIVKANKLHEFILKAFEQTKKIGFKMWGVNSNTSIFEMKQKLSAGLIYIVGNFYGLINNVDILVDEGKEIKARQNYEAGKESHERALKMYKKYGGVLKYRCIGVDSNYWGEKGGHQISRNNKGEKEATLYLHDKYKQITKIRKVKGIYDLQIKPNTKVFNTNIIQNENN